jgi:hypothetical protein
MEFYQRLSFFWMTSVRDCYKEIINTGNYSITDEQKINILDQVFVFIYVMLDRHLCQEFERDMGKDILNKTLSLLSEAYLWEINTRTDWNLPLSEPEIQSFTEKHIVSQKDHSRLEAVLDYYSKWRNLRLFGERGLLKIFAGNIAMLLTGNAIPDDGTEPDASIADLIQTLSSKLEELYTKNISLAEKDFHA